MFVQRQDGSSLIATKYIDDELRQYFVIMPSADGVGIRWYLTIEEAKELLGELEHFIRAADTDDGQHPAIVSPTNEYTNDQY